MHLLSKIYVAGAMYKVFCPKFQISIRTIQESSIVIIREFVLLANFCINPYVDFLPVVSKLLIPKLAYIALALHRHGWLRTRRYALLKTTRNLSNVDFLYAVHNNNNKMKYSNF